MRAINHHTLSDFRIHYKEALDPTAWKHRGHLAEPALIGVGRFTGCPAEILKRQAAALGAVATQRLRIAVTPSTLSVSVELMRLQRRTSVTLRMPFFPGIPFRWAIPDIYPR
jgi:hypothetical protein